MGDFNSYFFDPSENERAVLGESYMLDFIKSGEVKNTFCVLSNKRLYINGRYREGGSRIYKGKNSYLSVDLGKVHNILIRKEGSFLLFLLCLLSSALSLILLPSIIFNIYSASRRLGSFFTFSSIITLLVFLLPVFFILLYNRRKVSILRVYYEDESTGLNIRNFPEKEVTRFIEEIKSARDDYFRDLSLEPEKGGNPDFNSIALELTRYKELLDKGGITEEEYASLKKRVFSNRGREW